MTTDHGLVFHCEGYGRSLANTSNEKTIHNGQLGFCQSFCETIYSLYNQIHLTLLRPKRELYSVQCTQVDEMYLL